MGEPLGASSADLKGDRHRSLGSGIQRLGRWRVRVGILTGELIGDTFTAIYEQLLKHWVEELGR